MKAIVLEKPGQFRRVEIDEPANPAPGEALVRVHRVGICGSDVGGYLGKMPFYSYPRIPGHELGVEVLAVGAGVTHVKVGDRCSVEPYINCQQCFACQHGGGNCCSNVKVLGVHTDGGLRAQFVLPARKLHPAQRLSFDQLALVETLAIGCHAVNRGAPKAGDHVLVVGAGPIGLSVIEFVKLTGATLTVLDMNQHRLDYCRQVMGVQNTILFKGDGSELARLRKLTNGDLAGVVFDATGNPKSMCGAFQYVAHTGRLVFVGIATADVTFFDPLFHSHEMTLFASRNALPGDFTRIIQLIEQGQIDTRPWITHRSPFEELIANFPAYTKPETGVIKAIIEVQ
ncbi:MAG TPA: zinc-binding alcohol dehydrogenase family protein [Tepidisphaeraceae bacterium]|nr:zinc-binding alcohol dehydrogenase family protein [Tepidisphaeraceae bacterium]